MVRERWQEGMGGGGEVEGGGGRGAKGYKSMISIATSGWKKYESLFPFVFSGFAKFSKLNTDYIYIMKRTQHIF